MIKPRARVLFGTCLVGVLGMFSLTGCGSEGGAGTIQPPGDRPSEYAAREAAQESGAVKSGGEERHNSDANVMAHRRAAAAGHR